MASSSSAASNSQYRPRWKYDVFLNFRGEYTRRNFTSHLYEGLMNRGIFTFQDEKRLEYGDSIPEEILKAIKESQAALVVFSKNYATSRWCLNELVKIMECKSQYGQTVIPVFYYVDPSHVRNQSESFADAFSEHESKYKDDVEGMQKVQGWRAALTEVAQIKGPNINNGIESENIQQIIDHISFKLCKSASLSSLQDVVGINTHVEKLKSLLDMEINDVRIVGIWGMDGVGKTTIARAIFDTLSYQFKAASFLADVKENDKKNQLHSVQNTLLSELLRRKDDYVNNKYAGKDMIQSRLCSTKVLIVLDDIDHSDHLEYLAGDVGWFGNGSRVVVTTRNRDLIKKDDAVVYEVTPLANHEATQLFNQHAFRKQDPDGRLKKLSLEVVNHAKGLPLALKLWGSLLHRRGINEWRRTVDKIKKNSSSEIIEKLKISYDGLELEEQKIFLDMACFFRGYGKKIVMQILKSCDFEAESGLDVLIEKSLVFISENNTIEMHDLIQEMGKYVVKMQKDLGKLSRLWDAENFKEVMVNNTGTKSMEAIWLNGIHDQLCFSKKAMKNMIRLRILHIKKGAARCTKLPLCAGSREGPDHKGLLDGGFHIHNDSIEYLPNNLRWFAFDHYPWESLPENFEPKRLVHLDLQYNSLRHLWTGTKQHLPYLRELDLSSSENLLQTPDFTGMPNLECLDLSCCFKLKEVHHSLGFLKNLCALALSNCKSLEMFPALCFDSLEYLNLKGCSSLEKFPEILISMNLELKSGIGYLDLRGLENLVTLPSSICKLKSLVSLDVLLCSKLESLPEEIGDLENLECLDARRTLISRPPSSITRLNKLAILTFAKKKSGVGLRDGVYFVFPQVSEGLRSLVMLDLSYCNLKNGGLPEDIGSLSSLKTLNLRGNNFEYLPRSIAQLGALRTLDLLDCVRLRQLPEFPQQLDTIYADWSNDWICNSLFQNISSLQHDISASDSLSLRVLCTTGNNIPRWFHHWGTGKSVSVNLPENWYVCDNFLGFAVCYSGRLIDTTAHLVPLCNDGMLWITQKLALSNHSECGVESKIHFFLLPFDGLWDTYKANGKTPNDYGRIRLTFGEMKKYGFRLIYKDEMQEYGFFGGMKQHCIGTRRSRYDSSEHHHSMTNEASCSSSKKQRSHF